LAPLTNGGIELGIIVPTDYDYFNIPEPYESFIFFLLPKEEIDVMVEAVSPTLMLS
jgi:hypothetical protein